MLTLRQADQSDIYVIHEMAQLVFPDSYRHILSTAQLEYMLDWMYSIPNIRKQMESGHLFFIAYHDNELCGYASIEQETADVFHLQKLYVLPHFQGAHCGSGLFKKLIDHIKTSHPEPCRLELNVNRHNKAKLFYERMGMAVITEGDFPIGNDYYMNDYIMGMEI